MKSTTRLTDQDIVNAKQKSIPGYLLSLGVEPVNMIGGQLIYLSPLREERTPSFYVNPQKNNFNDFGGTEEMKGDSIRLVQQINHCSFRRAVEILMNTECHSPNSFSFSGGNSRHTEDRRISIIEVCRLQNKALLRYVANRGILLQHAFRYLVEVHYAVENSRYYAIGFKNDCDGYELRSPQFKGKAGNGVTTFDKNTDSVSLFEGFFDFLSALRYYNLEKPTLTTVILNTTNNLKVALPMLSNRKTVNCFLDNDDSGKKAVQKLIEAGFNAKDWSNILYPTSKDFNEFLVNKHNKAV